MPWTKPDLRTVRQMVRDDVIAALSGSVLIANSVLRVMADAMAALAHLTLRYIDWVASQLLPDTAETEWLDRHGDIWLTNADNSVGRKSAAYSSGVATFIGDVGGATMPEATPLAAGALNFETTQEVAVGEGLATEVPIRALQSGTSSNLVTGTTIAVANQIAGILSDGTVVFLHGGSEDETDEELRSRVLERIRNPPMGGDAVDYQIWTRAVPGVTRAWSSNELGPGVITVRFAMDDQRLNGIPGEDDINTVKAYLDTKRPVAIKDLQVQPPVPEPINFTISNLNPNTADVWTGIVDSVTAMLRQKAHPAYLVNGVLLPAQTIYTAWVSEAIMQAPGVVSFDLIMADHVMPWPGSLAVMGTVTHG